MKANISILTGAVHTGKSSALWDRLTTLQSTTNNQLSTIGGIVTPTINGKKMMIDIGSKEIFEFELEQANDHSTKISDYFFSNHAFDIAFDLCKKAVEENKEYIILDEIGKLELNNTGHHKTILYLLEHSTTNLVFIIRDSLLNKAKKKYFPKESIQIVDNQSKLHID
jgi:nucleoside-triphosphatase